MSSTVIIGAGPAGLTAARELMRMGHRSLVLEQDECVGGIARTVEFKGYRLDIGGHRFFTKVPEIQWMWEDVLGEDFLVRPRLSRIYYKEHFFDYPLAPVKALLGLGPVEAARIALSYAKAQLFPSRDERTFEQWVTNRFGRRLFEIFFKTYTEKVWGIPCSEIGADWAAQRIQNLDLAKAVLRGLLGQRAGGGQVITTLIDRFHYPRFGPGMIWERVRETLAEKGNETVFGARVVRVRRDGEGIRSVTVRSGDGGDREIEVDHCVSSMPIRELIRALDPPAPREVREAAERLRHRDFLVVALVVNRAEVFPDNWIYVHSPKVKMGRIQNYKNWSPDMVPDPSRTCLGLEYFVQEGDGVWSASDEELIALGTRECEKLGLVRPEEVEDGTVVRMPKAYPVYDSEYREALATIRSFVDPIGNLQLVGRNGLHRYNNQDHSMLTGIYAARNIGGAEYDVWDVNVEQEYHEGANEREDVNLDRLVPETVGSLGRSELLRAAFARYDPIAMGAALGAVLGVGLFLATAILLIRGDDPLGPNLSLLGNFFLAYRVTWGGAFLGLAEAGLGGFALGSVIASAINLVLRWEEVSLRRRIELQHTLDPLDPLDRGNS